jgi:hypothetical protein
LCARAIAQSLISVGLSAIGQLSPDSCSPPHSPRPMPPRRPRMPQPAGADGAIIPGPPPPPPGMGRSEFRRHSMTSSACTRGSPKDAALGSVLQDG